MGAIDVLSRKSGVIVGDDVLKLFQYAREHKFAIPAIVSAAFQTATGWPDLAPTQRMEQES